MSDYDITLIQIRLRKMEERIESLESRLNALLNRVHVGPTGNHAWRIEPPPAKSRESS